MTDFGPCGPTDGEAYNFINEGWETNRAYATENYREMEIVADYLQNFIEGIPLAAINTTVAPVLSLNDFGAKFSPPSPPTPDSISYNKPDGIGNLTLGSVAPPVLKNKPTFSKTAPSLDFSGMPAVFSETAPDTDLILSDPTLPEAPTLTLPDVDEFIAQLRQIDIPEFGSLDLPEFSAVRPVDQTFIPASTFNWSEDAYSSSIQTSLETEISRRFSGGTGLPDAFWNAFVERDTLEQEEAAQRYEEEVSSLWARNGWDSAGMGEAHAILRSRQDVFRKRSTKAREVWLKQVGMEEDSLRFSVVQGIASEQLLTGFHSDQAARSLQAAQAVQDVAIQIANLHIQRLNARYQGYATDAQVYRDRLQGELSKLDERRFELEKARIKSELNDQDIRVFLSQYEAADKLVQLFIAEWNGVRAQSERDKTLADILGEKVRTFGEKIRAKGLEFDSWSKKIDGQLGRARGFETEARAFGDLMRGYATESDAERTRVQAGTDVERLKMDKMTAEARRYEAESRAESGRIDALVRKFDGLVRLYESKGQTEETRVRSEDNRTQIVLEQMRAEENLQLRKSEVDINQVLRLLALEEDGLKSILDVRSQLVASLFSAFNLNTSMSGSFENAAVCSTGYTGSV